MIDDDGATPVLHCDINLDVHGPNEKTVRKWTADALRRIADKLDRDQFRSDHHSVSDATGKEIGTAYFDFYEENS